MPVDPLSPVAGTPAAGITAPVRTQVAQDFAAVLTAQQRAPEDLPSVTFGQMTGLSPSPTSAVLATPAAGEVDRVGAVGRTTAAGKLAWPVEGRVSSEFGPRVHPVLGIRRNHDGIDIAAATGTPIAAAADGKVTFAGRRGGYGNVVIIEHANGTETRYAHQDTISVGVGQTVRAGERVGTVGSTGLSTGPHLHFEVRRGGQPVDPRSLLA